MVVSSTKKSLRALSLGTYVVALASRGDYASIARISARDSFGPCLWVPEEDTDTAVSALIEAAPENIQHYVHRRRGIEAVLSGQHSTRARAVFRSRAFAACFERIFPSAIDHDAAVRLYDMGVPVPLLATTVLKHAPDWGARFLSTKTSVGRDPWRPSDDELVDVVIKNERPGAVLIIVAGVFGMTRITRFVDLDDPALLERLAFDEDFMADPSAAHFAHRILHHACRTGSERIVETFETAQAGTATSNLIPSKRARTDAVTLCCANCPHLAARVGALTTRPELQSHGLMGLVAYGAQDIAGGQADAPDGIRAYAVNYNVLRIMSGLGGLAYRS